MKNKNILLLLIVILLFGCATQAPVYYFADSISLNNDDDMGYLCISSEISSYGDYTLYLENITTGKKYFVSLSTDPGGIFLSKDQAENFRKSNILNTYKFIQLPHGKYKYRSFKQTMGRYSNRPYSIEVKFSDNHFIINESQITYTGSYKMNAAVKIFKGFNLEIETLNNSEIIKERILEPNNNLLFVEDIIELIIQ